MVPGGACETTEMDGHREREAVAQAHVLSEANEQSVRPAGASPRVRFPCDTPSPPSLRAGTDLRNRFAERSACETR
jgi:hypothetical protein